MKRRYVFTGALLALIPLALCAALAALYLELFVGFETEPMILLPSDAEVSSIMSGYAYAQAFVDEWQPGLHLTAVYARYGEDSQGRLVTTGDITYLFAGTREDWLAGIASLVRVHVLGATVVLDADTRMISYFRPSHTDRHLWGHMDPDEWGISEEDLLQVAEEYGGREFRRIHPGAEIAVEVAGHHMGDEWLQTYFSDERKLWILIELHSRQVSMAEGDARELFPSSWRTVGSLSR